MEFSAFGEKFTGESGTLQLMDDLGVAAQQDAAIMLGGGNPSHIPQVESIFRARLERILDSEYDLERLIGEYGGPAGYQPFIDALVELLRSEYGWQIDADNVALTNGSQTAFFYLFNMVAGTYADGSHKRILLPLTPEYIGYEDVGIADSLFTARRPQIAFLDDGFFKYRVDFDALEITDEIGAICVSRPTNPTGNVLTEEEIAKLSRLALAHNIPLIVDNAYGAPFPQIIFTEAVPEWEPHRILCMSLSKLGLPGARTGIVIACEEVIRAIRAMNAIVSLAPNGIGAALAVDMVRTRDILAVSKGIIRPHYEGKAQQAVTWMREALDGTDFHIHKPEGAFFLWLWCRGLPISCQALYERLKERGVVVVSGNYFFPGLEEEWQHRYECIRVSYAGRDELVHKGIQIIGEEVRRAYDEG